MSKKPAKTNYDLNAVSGVREFPAPKLSYHPPKPRRKSARIGLIGCGGITASHLEAYRAAAWKVTAFCDTCESAATARRDEFYPNASVHTGFRELLENPDIDVLDIALHADARVAVVEAAIKAGKHVLSQKPFAPDMKTAGRLVRLADRHGVKLAVNLNGRFSPYVSWIREAINRGMIGTVQSVAIDLNWDHTWILGTSFEKMPHVVLCDFAIHWFDMAASFLSDQKPRRVFATSAQAPGQSVRPPMLGAATVRFDRAIATFHFDAHSRFGPGESIVITGTEGTIRARGPVCEAHDITLHNKRGICKPPLEGRWFNDGFGGAMGELLRAIERDEEPLNSARGNLPGLAICFAAVRSADSGEAEKP